MTDYRNFWMRIENRADGLYVRANSTAGGSVAAPLVLPEGLHATRIADLLAGSGGAARGADGAARRDLAFADAGDRPAPSDREVGGALFRALFPGPVRDAFMRSLGGGKEDGVRIRLQIDLADPELAALAGLPWELLYNDVTRQALGRSRFTPIVRSLDVAQPYATPAFAPPLRVLLVLANPEGTHALGLDRERERIAEILDALPDVEVEVLEHATRAALYDRLDAGRFHVLHYMGHGGFDAERGGVLLLEDGAGCLDEVDDGFDDGYGGTSDPSGVYGAVPFGEATPPPFTPEAGDLMVASGFGDILDDEELVGVAEGVVYVRGDMVQDGFSPVSETVLSLPPGAAQSEPFAMEPGGGYVVLASCDNDCDAVGLRLYDASGALLSQDVGKEPALDLIGLPPGGRYLEVALDQCSKPECFVGVGVYRAGAGR